MKKNILIIGDSLGCPRPWIGVDLRSTYGYQLGHLLGADYFVANYSVGDNSTDRAVKAPFVRTFVQGAAASYVIVQLGIVDCAPRLMSTFERAIGLVASKIPLLRPLFNFYVRQKAKHRYTLTRIFPKTLVPIDRFARNLKTLVAEIQAANPVEQIFFINIAYPGEYLLRKSYNILRNIEQYNGAIAEVVAELGDKGKVVDLFQQTQAHPGWITEDDGHHIYKPAHDWIAREIFGVVYDPRTHGEAGATQASPAPNSLAVAPAER